MTSSSQRPSGMTLQLMVTDIEAARAFYTGLFGGPPAFEPHDDFLEWPAIPGQECWVQIVGAAERAPLRNRVRFRVTDVDSARHQLVDAGVECSAVSILPGTVAFCDFDDPWGNRLGYYTDLAPFGQAATYPGTSVHDESLFT